MRRATGGTWEMRSDPEGTWAPWIMDSAGRSYAVFMFFKELFEYGKTASLRGFAMGKLGSWKLMPPKTRSQESD